jgi:hypothetical protein
MSGQLAKGKQHTPYVLIGHNNISHELQQLTMHGLIRDNESGRPRSLAVNEFEPRTFRGLSSTQGL